MDDLRITLNTPSNLDIDTAVRRLEPSSKSINRSPDGTVQMKFGNVFMYRLLGNYILPEKFFPYAVVLTSDSDETSVQIKKRANFSPVQLYAPRKELEKQAKKVSELLDGN